jgi:endonuclease III
LRELCAALAKSYGNAPPLPSDDPFELVLWEQVAYLADDETRARAFAKLRGKSKRVTAKSVLVRSPADLVAIARAGGAVAAEKRADRMRASAQIVVDEHDGDLANSLASMKDAKARVKALRAFASIGAPGAEKILLFAKLDKALGLESNGLRVLVRVGFASEDKSYDKTWRAVRDATAGEIESAKHDDVIAWHQLVRRHGQAVCTRTKPQCPACNVRDRCAFGRP